MLKTFDLKTWDGFSEIPKRELDCLLDTTAINKKLADGKNNPYRWRVGSFRVPRGLQGENLKRACDAAGKKFVEAFERQGWTLASKLQVYPGQKYAYDISTGTLLLDQKEMRVRAIFKTKLQPVRIEVPVESVRVDPEQKATLAEVMRNEGIEVAPRRKR